MRKSISSILLKFGLVTLALSLNLFAACEIGLGASVDVDVPVISIDTPKTSAIIRDTFTISGTWTDDGTIEDIDVFLKNNETDQVFSFKGEMYDENNWKCLIDPSKPDPKKPNLKIVDGKYEVTIKISDTAGHKSETTRSYVIDNTAPVVVLSRPSSKKEETDTNKIESYGQYLTIEGQAADDNDIEKIVIKFYSKDDPATILYEKEITSIPPTISLDVAKFLDKDVYSAIYGDDKEAGEKAYYCEIVAYDGAKRYPVAGEEKEDDNDGNSEPSYILWADWEKFQTEYQKATASTSKIKIPDLYALKAGKNTTDTGRSAKTQSLISNLFSNAISAGSFKLNPLNNPTFSISGLELGIANDVENDRSLTIQLAKGLDGISLDTENMKVYLIPVSTDATGKEVLGSKIYPQQSEYQQKGDGQFLTTIQKENCKDKNGTVVPLEYGKTYIIGVEGADTEGNKIVPSFDDSVFYIRFKAKNVAPGLTLTSPSPTTSYLMKGKTLKIAGTTSVPDGYPTISIVCKKGEEVTGQEIYSHKVTEADKEKIEGGLIIYNFEYEIPIDGDNFKFDQTQSNQYVFDITSDMDNMPTTRTKTVIYDIDGPTISIDSMLPTAKKYDLDLEDGSGEDGYLNGDVTMKVSILDDYDTVQTALEEGKDRRPYFIIVDENGNELPFMVGAETKATVKHYITTPAKQSFIIHTKDIADGSNKKEIKVKIFAEDRAGNKGVDIEDISKTSFERDFTIDQSTDAPVILPKTANTNTVKLSEEDIKKESNFKNMYSGNQTVSYRLIDDDGLSSVTYKLTGTNYNPEAVTIALNDVTEYPLDLIMPEDPGIYNVDISVTDNKNNPAVTRNFYVRVTAAAPVIKSIKFDKDPVGIGENIVAHVAIKSDQKPFTLIRTIKKSNDEILSETTLKENEIPELDSANPTITDSFSLTQAGITISGDYKVYYEVHDVNYKEQNPKYGTGDESITVDLNEPVISDVKLASEIHENSKWYNSKNLALSLTAEDKQAGDTGVSQVRYSLDDGQNWIPLAKSGSVYSGTIIFQNDSDNNTLRILAEDAAGNAAEKTAAVKIDTITPIVSYTATNLKNAAGETVTSITSGDYYSGEAAVTITGIVSDTNFENSASYVTVEATNSATNITPVFVAGTYKFTITPTLQDGETKITIKVKDFAGNTKENIITIHRDTKGPGIEIKLPQADSANPLDDESYTFRINANDGNDGVGVAKIYYKFTNDNSTPTDWGTGETFSGGDFYISRDLIKGHVAADGKLTEGNWYLHVKAEDKSGNVTTTNKNATDTKLRPRYFVVDKEDPSIDYVKYEDSVLTEKQNFYYDATTFTLTGSVSDTNGIKQVKVGGDIVEVTNKTWSKAITITPNQRNEIIVEVEDVAGRKTPKTYYVYKDSVAPVINLNAPAESVETLTDAKYTFAGSVSDAGSGIQTAKYLFTQTPFANENAIKTSASTGTGWTSIDNGELSVEKNLGGTAAANLKEGRWYLYIYAKDNVSGSDANHVSVFSKPFWVDRALPTLTETTVNTTGAQVKAGGKLTLSGTASDNNGIENIVITDGTGENAKNWTIAGTAITNGNWSKEINPGTDTQTENKLTDGTHTLTITATDKAGRSSSVQRTVVVDTAAPTHGTLSVTSTGTTVGTGDAAKTWYKSSFINIKIVDVADPANGSGVSTVEYTIDNGAHWNPMSGSEGIYTATVNCTSQGSNTIKVQIKDVVGNVKDAGGKTVYVDTVLPTLTTSKVKYRTTNYESSSEILVNGDYGYDLQIEVADAETSGTDMNSGIAAVKYAYGNHTIAATQSGNYWIVNVPVTNGVDKYDPDKTNPIYALITDKAGNEAKERILTVTKDSDPPSVSFKSVTTPGSKTKVNGIDVEDVNGTITINGSASDKNKLSTVVLKYQKAGETAWNDLDQTSESTANNWIAECNTTTLINNTKYTIKAIATDAAGNTTEATKDIYVNQDTDRPVITLTNIDLAESIFGNNEIYGNVSDDDGVPSTISCYIGNEKPTTSTTWTTPVANSDFTYTNGSFKLKLSDGPQKIWFKLNDGTKDYISSDLTTYSTDAQKTEVLNSVKIVDSKNNKFGYLPETGTTIKASAVSTTIDTTAPFITSQGWTYATTTLNWQSISSKPTTGGTGNKKEIYIRVYAYDINGVDTIKLKVPKNSSDKSTVSGYSTAAEDMDNDYYIYNFKQAASTDTDATKEVDGHTYNKWTSAKIIATGMESGLRECKLEVFDGAKTTTETVSITIDNTPAEFEFTSHKDNQTVYGIKDIEVGGTVNAADMKHVYYSLTKDDVTTPAEAKNRIGTNWKEILFENNKLSAVIKFDGDTAATAITGVTHEKRLREWLKDLYEVSDIDNYNDTEVLKLWVYVVDEIENSSEPEALSLKVIPNGDKPVVKITYPDDNAKLGGTIRFSGETTIETNSVEKVYAQIIVPTSIDNSNDDWVTKLDKLIEDTKNKSTGSEPYYRVVNITSTLKGIEVSGTPTSWNFAINSHHELEKENATPDYTVNIIAKSASGKISDTVSRTVQIDKNAPSLSDMQLVKLKNETAANKFAESNIDKRITYKEDMWISGQWYLIGSVTDGNGVKQLLWHDGSASHTLVEGNNSTNTGTINNSESDKVVQSSEHTTHYTEPTEHTITAYDYDFRIPIGEDSGYGTITYKISAVDATAESNSVERTITVNYDCTSPDFKATVSADDNAVELSGTGNKVQNSSGMYSVYGTFDEEGKQSGFERIAMYFTRTIGNTTNVLDPLVTKDRSSGTNDKHNNYYLSTGFQYTSVASHGDGIYWKELTATKTESDTITVSVSDDWIRKGGICKVDGVIYKIKTVTTTTITVDGTLTTSNSSKKIYVTPALVIDNLSPESKKQGATYNGLYQKNVEDTTVISGGDGDWLIEGVTKQTNSYPWSASLNSQNMLDGPVTIHFVAFDKAGNATEKSYSGNVANNAPRLAGVTVWTDYNGNAKGWRNTGVHAADYEDETKSRYYSRVRPTIDGKATDRSNDVTSKLIVSGNTDDVDGIAANSSIAFMKVTDTVKFIPEIVGGNGDLYYEYKIGKKAAFTVDSETKEITGFTASTTSGSKALKSAAKAAITNDDGTTAVSGTDNGQNLPTVTDANSVTYVTGNTESVITFDGATILGALDNSTSNAPTWFDIVISDSTEGDTKLSCEMQIALQNNYTDVKAPEVKIRPFYWNSKTENSVGWTKDSDNKLIAEGHIELEKELTDAIKNTEVGTGKTKLGDDPKVSGKIKIEGYAFDDIKLNQLYVQMDNHTKLDTEKLASTYTNGTWTSRAFADGWGFSVEDIYCNSDGHLAKWTLTVDTAERTNKTELDQKVIVWAVDARGSRESTHTVDTNTKQTALKEVDVWSNAKKQPNALTTYYTDFYCNTKVSSSTPGSTIVYKKSDCEDNMTYYYKMDIVPYITTVKTRLSKHKTTNPSVYNRTALGHYPVQSIVSNIDSSITLTTDTSEDVILYGFNINGSATIVSGSNTFTVGNATDSLKIDNSTNGQLGFNVARLSTGKLDLTVNGIPVMNNINENDAKGTASETGDAYANWYNRQGNGDTNNILTDDVEFDVWEFNDSAAVPINGLTTGINMKINQTTGMLNYAFANGGLYFSMGGNPKSFHYQAQRWRNNRYEDYSEIIDGYNDNYSSIYWAGDWDTFAGPCVGFHVDDLGYTYSVCSGGDTNSSGSVDKWDLYTSRWGGGLHSTAGTLNDAAGTVNDFHALRLEENALKTGDGTFAYSLMKYRYLSPEFASTVTGTNTNLYLVYYDALTNQIRFRAGTFSGATTGNTGGFNDTYQAGAPSYYATTNCQVIANGKSGASFISGYANNVYSRENVPGISGRGAGQYVDVAVVKSNGKDVVCVVWYDAEDNCCKFSSITDPITAWESLKGDATAKNWTEPQTIFAEGGEYCHIVADKDNHLHIAAYAGNGDVKYAYLESPSSTASTCTVDASGAVGEHLTLDVAVNSKGHAIPYIGYYTSAIKMPKYAYLVDPTVSDATATFNQAPAGADSNERFTGAWEVTVVPSPSRMTTNREDKVNVGVWKNNGVLKDSKINGQIKNSSISNTLNGYQSVNWSKTYGNGTSNGILGYQISTSTGSCLETAQLR